VTGPLARARRLALVALLPVAAALGCGGGSTNDNPYMRPPPPGGTAGGPMRPPVGNVVVAIDAPMAGMAAYGPGSLVEISARVAVENGSDFIDGSTVAVTVTEQGSMQPIESGLLVVTNGDVYEGRVSLGADLKSGIYTVTVTARSSGGATGMASVDIEVDGGPIIIITSPVEGRSYKRSLTLEVIARDAFGLATDAGGAVIPPSATIGPVMVPLADAGLPDGDTFRGSINFDLQNPPLFGPQLLTVSVTNVRGIRAEVQVIFFIDNEGPIISATRPVPGEIIGGITLISALISDNAGVLDSSVVAIIGDETGTPLFEVPLKPAGGGVYSALFDSGRLTQCRQPQPASDPTCIVFPTISFRASDLVDNETVLGYDIAVDNIPPLADLDPPMLRDRRLDRVFRCSWEFDPLGNDTFYGDMPNDNTFAPQVFDLRARVQDQGNAPAPGTKLTPLSGVDPNRTDVYVLRDTSQPLIVDTDGNGTCDSINPLLIPTTEPPVNNNQVLKIRLGPVPPGGSADFTPDPSIPDPQNGPCARGLDPAKPEPMCTFAQPTIAISYAFGQPAIWSVEPIDQQHCHGNQLDTKANNITNGWLCIAVGSADLAGSFGVSRVLRVYVDQAENFVARHPGPDGNGFGASAAAMGPPPECTGRWDRATNMVTPGACSTLKYPAGELCYRGECY
jgi:hypothetical protein